MAAPATRCSARLIAAKRVLCLPVVSVECCACRRSVSRVTSADTESAEPRESHTRMSLHLPPPLRSPSARPSSSGSRGRCVASWPTSSGAAGSTRLVGLLRNSRAGESRRPASATTSDNTTAEAIANSATRAEGQGRRAHKRRAVHTMMGSRAFSADPCLKAFHWSAACHRNEEQCFI